MIRLRPRTHFGPYVFRFYSVAGEINALSIRQYNGQLVRVLSSSCYQHGEIWRGACFADGFNTFVCESELFDILDPQGRGHAAVPVD